MLQYTHFKFELAMQYIGRVRTSKIVSVLPGTTYHRHIVVQFFNLSTVHGRWAKRTAFGGGGGGVGWVE